MNHCRDAVAILGTSGFESYFESLEKADSTITASEFLNRLATDYNEALGPLGNKVPVCPLCAFCLRLLTVPADALGTRQRKVRRLDRVFKQRGSGHEGVGVGQDRQGTSPFSSFPADLTFRLLFRLAPRVARSLPAATPSPPNGGLVQLVGIGIRRSFGVGSFYFLSFYTSIELSAKLFFSYFL